MHGQERNVGRSVTCLCQQVDRSEDTAAFTLLAIAPQTGHTPHSPSGERLCFLERQ